MATKIRNFKPPRRKPKATKYPWKSWLRVGTYRIKKGKDFTCRLESMKDIIYKAAKAKGKVAKVWLEPKTQTVVFRIRKA